jgi:hypothetical protein
VGVNERVTLSFADPDRQIQGVAISGAGTLLKLAAQLTAAPPPQLDVDGGAWSVRAGDAFALTLTPLGTADPQADPGVTLHRATGTVGSQPFDGLALARRDAEADAEACAGLALERSLAILFDAQLALALRARRPPGAGGHGEEQLDAVLLRGEPLELVAIEKPRLSSTYGADGRLTHAGLEVWESEESELAMRIGGEALGSGELAGPDGARTQVTFVAWHHGRRGLGSYSITRAA